MATATLSKKQWPFAPQAVNNCLLWLDAADQSSYTPGASVTTWRNKGYSGGNATTTSGTIGSTSAEINGSPAMSFAASAYMTAPSMTFTQTTRTAFVVVNIGSTGSTRYFTNGGTAIDMQMYSYYSGTYTDLEMNYSGHINYQTTAPYPIFNTTSIVCGTTLSTNGGIFVNGLAQTPYATNAPLGYSTGTTTTQYIGYTGGASFILGEVMIFDGAITDIQRQQVEGYLAAKWGLQSYLPTTHPYFTLNNLITTAFEPTEIPTCALWLDASDATSIVGTGIATWKDKSGNGYNATGVNSPVFLKSTGGVSFTAASAQYFTMSVPYSKTNTIFMVATPVPSNASGMYYTNTSATNSGDNFIGGFSSSYLVYYIGTNSVQQTSYVSGTPTSPFIAAAVKTTGVSSVGYYNGTQVFSIADNTSDVASTWAFLGAAASGANYLTATVYEFIIYNVALTANQIQAVNAYLGAKWNIAEAGQGSIAPVVNPLAINGCQLWLDAADATTIVPVVSQWNDKSGNGYNLVAGTGQTTYTSFGPGPSIKLNTSYLYVNKVVDLTQYTVFSVLLSQTAINNQPTVTGRPNTSTSYNSLDGFGLYVDAVSPLLRFYFATTNINNSTTATTISQPLVLSSYTCTSTGVAYSWINGVAGTSNVTGGLTRTSTGQGFSIGGEWSGSAYTSQSGTGSVCNVYEVIVYNSVLTTTQRLQVENYLMAKWGTGRNFWIDASDATTVTRGTNVLTWRDKSGNGNNATAVGKPVITANAINGTQAMYLADAPYFLGSVSITTTTFTCFTVATTNLTLPNARGRDQRLVSLENGGNVDYGRTDGAIALFNQGTTSTIATYRVSGPLAGNAMTTGTPFLAVSQYTGTNAYLWYNGTAGTSTGGASSGTFAITKYGIGNQANPSGETWNGYVGEVIIYNAALTDTQRQQIQTYLGNKWGLTVSNQTAGITNPTLIPGCVLWLDAADSTTITTAVSQMTDKSGNSYTITQATATYQPALTNNYLTLGTSLNSYMNMNQAAINNTSSWTLFLVFNPSSSTNWIMAKQFDGTNSYNMLSMTNYTSTGGANTTGTTGVLYFRPYNAGTLFTGPAALTTSSNQLLTMICNGTNIYYYVNGVLSLITNGTFTIQSQTGATNATLGAWIVSGSLTNSGVTNFQLGELAFYNSALTTIQNQQIESALMSKWSITNTVQTANGSLIDTPFFPTDITGCALWLDGADTSSITMTGTAVTSWADKSGNARNATAFNSPTYSASALGIVMNGTNNYMTSSVTVPTATHCLFAVHSPTTITGNLTGNTSLFRFQSTYYIVFPYMNGTTPRGYINSQDSTTTAYNTSVLVENSVANTINVIAANIAATSQTIYKNGVIQSTGAGSLSNVTSDSLTIGTLGSEYYSGTIYEMIVYNTTLTTAQIAQVNKYLQSKWNTAITVTTIPTPVYNRVFQPVDITGLAMWFDAADNSTITSSSSLVTQWNDKSGNGYNATNSTYVSPTYSATGFNSKYPGLLFNGTSTMLATASILPTPVLSANGTDTTIFVVFNRLGSSPNSAVFGLGGAAVTTNYNTYVLRDPWATSANSILDIGNGTLGRVSISNSVTGPQIYSLWRSGTSTYFYNYGASLGSNLSSSSTVGTTSQPLNIGGGFADSCWFNSYISEFIIYNYALSNSQRQQVEAYLAWKWGLSASLTTGHPGRTLPSFSTQFSPKSISGISLWLDAYDITTLFTNTTFTTQVSTSGQVVRGWADKSGNGLNNTTTDTVIVYNTTSLGYPSIYFPGTQTAGFACALSMGTAGVSNATYFLVVRSTIAGAGGTYLYHAGSKIRQIYASSNLTYMDYNGIAGINGSINVTNVTNIVTRQDTTSTGLLAGWDTGNSFGSTTLSAAANSTQTSLTLGGALTGYFCEIIIYNSVLSTAQRQQVEGYLAWKWGAVSSLPTSHAYKKNAP